MSHQLQVALPGQGVEWGWLLSAMWTNSTAETFQAGNLWGCQPSVQSLSHQSDLGNSGLSWQLCLCLLHHSCCWGDEFRGQVLIRNEVERMSSWATLGCLHGDLSNKSEGDGLRFALRSLGTMNSIDHRRTSTGAQTVLAQIPPELPISCVALGRYFPRSSVPLSPTEIKPPAS